MNASGWSMTQKDLTSGCSFNSAGGRRPVLLCSYQACLGWQAFFCCECVARRHPTMAALAMLWMLDEACQGPAADVVSTKVHLELDSPEVLLVLDPNGVICWEEVDLDAFTNATLLHWLYQQNDVLTLSTRDSTGLPVQARLTSSPNTFAVLRRYLRLSDQAIRIRTCYCLLSGICCLIV